jgi:hypothetical protein
MLAGLSLEPTLFRSEDAITLLDSGVSDGLGKMTLAGAAAGTAPDTDRRAYYGKNGDFLKCNS